jgi:putative colanic acid biosynthesis glycosyltransferase
MLYYKKLECDSVMAASDNCSMSSESKPFFSVVTVALNDLSGLRRTRASIESQVSHDFEWIVIDGASTDGTAAELESCLTRNFSYVSEKDRGVYDAMNKGLARTRGRYVIFMNSSDCFASPSVLEVVKRRILETGQTPDIVFGDALEEIAGSKLALKKARPIRWLNYGMHTHHQAMFYAGDSLRGMRFDESFSISADYDLTCRIYRKHGGSLALDLPVCIFAGGGLSQNNAHLGRSENWRVQRDVLGHRLIRRMLTRASYLASYRLREKFHSLYVWLRFQHVPPTS